MQRRVVLLFFLLVCGGSFCHAQSALRTMKHLEKGQLGKVIKVLERTTSKDPADPANNFILAHYYIHPQLSYEAIDSAHFHIKRAREGYQLIDEKKLKKYHRKGMDSLKIEQLSDKIDSLAFLASLELNSEVGYNDFIEKYPGSIQIEEAIELRNEVAYQNALAEKTPVAMQEFFRKYPEAKQAKEAKDAFETLYYEQKTQSKTVERFKDYLRERPQSVYADEAAWELLKITSAGANQSIFEAFKEQYPKTEAAKIATTLLNHMSDKAFNPELMVHVKNNTYHFYDISNKKLLGFELPGVITDSCRWIKEVLIRTSGKKGDTWYLKNGEVFMEGPVNDIVYLGSGFFKAKYPDQYKKQLLHISQDKQLSQSALDFIAIDDYSFAKKENNGWQLISLLGEEILKNTVDSIWKINDVYFFRQDKKMAVTTISDLRKEGRNDLKSLALLYTDYEILEDGMLWLTSNNYQTVLDASLKPVIPLQEAEIDRVAQGWTIFKNGQYEFLDNNFAPLYNRKFDKVHSRNNIIALKAEGKWAVSDMGNLIFPDFRFDSVRLFNSWITFGTTADEKELIFHEGKNTKLADNEIFKLLNSHNEALEEDIEQIRFVDIINDKGYHKIYNGYGKLIHEGSQLNIGVLTSGLLQITRDNKRLLLDSAGVKLVENLDAIGNLQEGLIPLLKNKKFGALIVSNQKLIPYISVAKIQPFLKDSIFIYRKDGLSGLINAEGKEILTNEFNTIEYVNDSMAIVSKDDDLKLINIYTKEVIINGIVDIEKVVFKLKSYYILRINSGYGLIDQLGETLIPFIFNSLEAYFTKEEIIWMAERSISEIDYQVLAYFDQNGTLLFREGLTNEEYLKTVCD
ncbi:WG repeat-containing protein [Marivirga sp. S37H4]|uniref:WG repeat-containing protein n=1 Tax=Marivirga aurantiaca TaxID=2802615 RepID=A0A934WY87_9BACT|nr:WG repeat-containing protein [Marivirga aurantiaca]MBK6265087.1 WG repeat-containing protein [Marivirga aurantiaca]